MRGIIRTKRKPNINSCNGADSVGCLPCFFAYSAGPAFTAVVAPVVSMASLVRMGHVSHMAYHFSTCQRVAGKCDKFKSPSFSKRFFWGNEGLFPYSVCPYDGFTICPYDFTALRGGFFRSIYQSFSVATITRTNPPASYPKSSYHACRVY